MILKYISALLLSYLVGSFSTAITLSRAVYKKDVRELGSGNAGATNVARVYGIGAGLATFAGDTLKTFISMKLGFALGREIGFLIAAFGCFCGHNWPIYYKFRGGKGVSVSAAIALMLDYRFFLIIVAVFFIVAFSSKRVSLSSITAAAVYPFVLAAMGRGWETVTLGAVIGALVIFLHRSNIKRLISGTEAPFKAKSVDVKSENASKE